MDDRLYYFGNVTSHQQNLVCVSVSSRIRMINCCCFKSGVSEKYSTCIIFTSHISRNDEISKMKNSVLVFNGMLALVIFDNSVPGCQGMKLNQKVESGQVLGTQVDLQQHHVYAFRLCLKCLCTPSSTMLVCLLSLVLVQCSLVFPLSCGMPCCYVVSACAVPCKYFFCTDLLVCVLS